MTDFYGISGPVQTDVGSIYEYQSTGHQVLATTAKEAWAYNPVPALMRWSERAYHNVTDDPLPKDQIQQRIDEAGVDLRAPNFGISEASLQSLIEAKRNEMSRRQVLDRSPGGVGLAAAQFGVGLAVSFADPINIASGFIPVGRAVGAARAIEAATTTGARVAARARVGAIEGAVGAVAVEPLVYGIAQTEQADYTLNDSFLNVVFGTIMGGGLHVTAGAIGDRFAGRATMSEEAQAYDALGSQAKMEFMRGVLGQALDDTSPQGGGLLDVLRIRDRAQATEGARVQADAGISTVGDEFVPANVLESQLDTVRAQIEANNAAAIRKDIIANVEQFAEPIARERNPELFNRADRLDEQIAWHRTLLDDLRAQKMEAPELKALQERLTKAEQELARVRPSNKLRMQKLTEKRDTIEQEIQTFLETDTPDQARVRGKITDMDQKRRDLGVEISKASQKAANEILGGKSKRMSIKAAEQANAGLHRIAAGLESRIGNATQRDITNGTFSPGRDGIDLATNQGIYDAVAPAVERARGDAQAGEAWQNKTFTDVEALTNFDRVEAELKETTPDEAEAEIAEFDRMFADELGEEELPASLLADLEEVDDADVDVVTGIEEYSACMIRSAV